LCARASGSRASSAKLKHLHTMANSGGNKRGKSRSKGYSSSWEKVILIEVGVKPEGGTFLTTNYQKNLSPGGLGGGRQGGAVVERRL